MGKPNKKEPTIRERILELLSDGRRHRREEILAIIDPQLEWDAKTGSAVAAHIWNLRKALPSNQGILCVYYGGTYHYQHVCYLASNDE